MMYAYVYEYVLKPISASHCYEDLNSDALMLDFFNLQGILDYT